ncbi:MAG: acetylglutamate kinase [Planctomycetes bacterium]|nr:acetylglutamate kinase [Planctomycetota bacterium]MCW8140767.1 acetylglutamate kinase [Planctomycetota bacterium]
MESSYILPLKRAVPYIRLYKGKVFVIKVGGSVLKKPEVLDAVAEDIGVLSQLGVSVVVVHGGGPQATELSRQLGHEPTVIAGRRVTGDKDIDIVKMVFAGRLNLDLTGALEEHGTRAVGLSGADASFMKARRRAPSAPPGSDQQVDWGHVGDIESVDPAIIYHLLGGGYVPVICSLASDGQGNVLNVNADVVATSVAIALKAEKLLFLSDTHGLLDDPKDAESTLSYVTPAEIEARKKSGQISGGMLPKIDSCLAAVRGGVRRTHIIPGLRPMALLTEVFTNEGCGTMILGPEESQTYARDELAEGDDA